MPKNPYSASAAAADSPVLAQLRARAKMLQHKLDHRIPASADRKEESTGRTKFHLGQVKQQIASLEKKS